VLNHLPSVELQELIGCYRPEQLLILAHP